MGTPTLGIAAGSVEADSLNGFYVTLGPNIQNTKVDKTISVGDGLNNFFAAWRARGNPEWVGGLQPVDFGPNQFTATQPISSSESKTGVLPQLTLGYMHPVWRQVSLGVEGFYAPKTGSNIVSDAYGASGLLAYNFATQTQTYLKLSYVSTKTNITSSQQFYNSTRPAFGPTGSNAVYVPGNAFYVDPDFKIRQQLNGVGVALGARQLLPFSVLGGRHLFAGGEVSYTEFSSKTVASPYYNDDPNRFPSLNGSITNTKISAKQYGVNLYVGYHLFLPMYENS